VGAPERALVTAPTEATTSLPGSRAELWLQAVCAGWLVAVRARHVDRLLLPEEGRLLDDDPRRVPPACLGVLGTAGGLHSAWDLGLLLGFPPQDEAWVLVTLGAASVALRTGACVGIAPLPATDVSVLPATLFRVRPGAIVAAFPAAAGRRQRQHAPVGLALDLEALLSDDERAHAEAACLVAAASEHEHGQGAER
jgi:hypothetical protein